MKKCIIILSLFSVLCLDACKTREYAVIGMQETEFLNHNSKAQRVQATEQGAIYRISLPIIGSYQRNNKFYYFINNKLTRIDEGVRPPDVLIQNVH